MTITETTATVTPISPTTPARATWKQHGNPLGGFEFFGTAVKAPAAKGVQVAKIAVDEQGITLKSANGRQVKDGRFGTATKFWAVVPEDAKRFRAPGIPRPKAEPQPKVEITAPKGGTQTVSPKKGAIAKAVKASGMTLMAISREHGLNPSQMRRLTLGQVSKVDLPRAEAIAQALGADLGTLFEAPVDKAKVNPAGPKAE
jgi:hypothetical protein